MIDPRSTLVLIRDKEDLVWHDRTSTVQSYEASDTTIVLTYLNGSRSYTYSRARAVVLTSPRQVPVSHNARAVVRGVPWTRGEVDVLEFDGPDGPLRKVFRTTSAGEERGYCYPAAEVEILLDTAQSSPDSGEVLRYFRQIVEAKDADHDPMVGAYRSMDFVHPDSALARYLDGTLAEPKTVDDPIVFPFSCNLSQREAVQRALAHSISVIEGPPGTGKTETILNLVANIVTADLGSVGVVSFSNSAVENVGEKLEGQGFGHLVAGLGRREKRDDFFARQSARNQIAEAFVHLAPSPPDPDQLDELGRRVRRLQEADRERAETRALLDEYEVEHRHFEQHRRLQEVPDLHTLPLLRRSSERIIDFLVETRAQAETDRRPGLLTRIRRYFRYGSLRGLDPADSDVVLALQSGFYRKRIDELAERLSTAERELESARFDDAVEARQRISRDALAAAAAARLRENERIAYSAEQYRHPSCFPRFLRDYPVILSTCHSLRSSIPTGQLIDYLIIDEASQVDLLSASLAMASCRNLVVVGDLKQLAPISDATPDTLAQPNAAYDYRAQSILSSLLELYGTALPRTLLREHYRCHPTIIGFCNTAFYDGELIPHTTAEGRPQPAMRIHPTVRGNHMRRHHDGGRSNQREIDVVVAEVLPQAPHDIGPADIAVAAPYRKQVGKAADLLVDQIDTVDTVHRLQGREKRMVVLTTVLSETWQGHTDLTFVDDPRLVNVAVSRAIDYFVLVTNHERLPRSRYLRDLAGYIVYHYPDQATAESGIISVFDLLYREYSARLEPLAVRLRPEAPYRSEEAVRVLLGDILGEPRHEHLRAETQILLRNLVPDPTTLTADQTAFVRRTASLDFVVYNRITRRPVLAIEVDGFRAHENNPVQLERDGVKDAVLAHVGIPLLRLPTTGSGEEQRIRDALDRAERLAS
jgi:hypothetical protein